MQKIIFLCLVVAKLIRELIYLFIGVAVVVFLQGFGFGDGIDSSGKISFIILIVVLILISYALPYLLKNKWPSEVAKAEAINDKPRKVFTYLGVALIIIAIIAFFIFMQSI
ncbi:hypothetical protein A2738_02190 [Candidatus Nomurabacteria bacterium RIFCSPHIGHO2_01_FULL_42_15]|uniref:DUF5671 domain-containing protein n=1 Tax=Candidatus Nomurabacteria bacterium RIFCSPHIGHO2_01_FULL_42_15 TaxID=1801742 RepID=A0A1F6VF24_9BACT|nr:MAG: hypothetical protein A2738_02190 [Candidatus Nomurabacteria bacterium RIFCSPHIGHO2_01_FULL_42_15]OGI93412.1 MAG: hypothetical protein A3A99_01920 [Candidatus Nomurabacteria bacterium RIFCSPLOWO2_01_FULL_41_18]